MKPWHWMLLVFLVILFGSCTYGFLSGLRSDVYHGRAVDEETGAPLVGAVVTVIWSKSSYLGMEAGPKEYLNAQETVTDNAGTFILYVSSGLDWDPFTVRVRRPWIVIYQPGYEPLMLDTLVRHGFKTKDALISVLKSGATIKLRKLRKEEVRKYTDHMVVTLNLPLNRIPNLIRAVNAQRRLAGFDPFTIESPEKGKPQ